VKNSGKLPKNAGQETFTSKFNGRTFLVDHGSGYVNKMQHQVLLMLVKPLWQSKNLNALLL